MNPATLSEALAFDITERRKGMLREKIKVSPRRNPIMSDISECDRQLVYGITDWDKRPLHDEDLQARFNAGNLQEREIIRELSSMGYDVLLSQMPVEVKHSDGCILASGKIDGFVKYHGTKIPCEIKSAHPNVFESIDNVDDLQRKPYLRKYIRQLMLYMYGNNVEEGIFIFTDCLGGMKVLPIHLDYGECEAILQRLERVHKALHEKVLPERIAYRDEICGKCPFAHICLPDILRKESEIIVDEELIARLERREAVSAARSEFERLDKSIKADIKKRVTKRAIAGDFVIQISDPIEIPEKVVKGYTMNRVSIDRLGDLETPKLREAS